MRNWDDLKFCLALSRHKTMNTAARALDTNPATVSRRIQRVSDDYNQPLFTKDGSEWCTTELGEEVVQLAETLEESMGILDDYSRPEDTNGTIRISCSLQVLQSNLNTNWGPFLLENPSLNISFSLAHLSLAYGEVDMTVTTRRPEEGRILRKKVGELKFHAYCNEKYENELTGWIQLVSQQDDMIDQSQLENLFNAPARLKLEGLNLGYKTIRNAPFAIFLPTMYVQHTDYLVMLPNIDPIVQEIWVSYHYTRKGDPWIRKLIDRIETRIF